MVRNKEMKVLGAEEEERWRDIERERERQKGRKGKREERQTERKGKRGRLQELL